MKQQFALAGALTLALTAATCVEALDGVIIISTRKNICADQGADNIDEKGPGMTTPGDVAMGNLLGNYGYSSRLILDAMIGADAATYLEPKDANFKSWSGHLVGQQFLGRRSDAAGRCSAHDGGTRHAR
ncbi:MAG: hypothetical protein FJ403_05005 [Verrucomicrobia bacterium]|nr:hypothetical protein [Verrucomicrobiota bacterium]